MKFIKQYQRKIIRSIVSLASLFVIFLCVAHITIPLISPHTDYFEKLLSRTLHHPVAIRQVNFGWRGLDPQLRFSDIAVKDEQSKEKILTIKKLNFSIGFFSSLWHREILPSAISISGAQLDLYQNQDGSWEFLNNQKTSIGNVAQIANWVLTQARISLANINLTIHYANGVALVVQRLQLELKQRYYPRMTGSFLLSTGGRVDFSWRWLDSASALSHSQMHLKINSLLLEPWLNSSMAALGINKLPLLSGLINGEAWLNWRDGKLAELHAIVSSPNLSEFNKGVNPIKFSADFSVKNGDIDGYFDIDDISKLKQFIPDNLSARAKLWLSNAFLAGSVSHAKVTWLGATKQFKLILPVYKATLHFAPKWPDVKNINALLTFNNKSLVIEATSGEISGNPIIHAVTVIPDVTQSVMTIDSQTGGTLQNGLDFLAAAPLPIAPFVTNWQGQGPILIDLHLAINLKNRKNKVDSSGLVHFYNNSLIAPKQVFSWNKIQGELNFQDNKLTANNLRTEFLNSPLNVNLTTRYFAARPIYSLNFAGNLSLNNPHLEGVFPYQALLTLSLLHNHAQLVLDARSNLVGLTSHFAAPLKKAAKTAWPLHLHLRSGTNQNYLVMLNLANMPEVIAEIRQDGVKTQPLIIKSKQYTLTLVGDWLWQPHNKTHLMMDVATQNLGALLVSFGFSPVVYQGYGTAHFDLYWDGPPSKITAQAASGQVSFDFKDGRIMKLSQKAESDLGLGKILNLLSLQSLPFTIASGFQSLGEKGFQFDELTGSINLAKGKGTINSLSLVGPIAWVTATGDIDFANKLYDLKLTVIPNITSSIPLILAIASGPIAGVIGLVANKILGSQIGKAAEQTITVKGSWENPSVLKLPKPQTTTVG